MNATIFNQSIAQLIERDLRKLQEEIKSYGSTESIWVTPGNISNSAGNLALHICGNLQHFIGAVLGESGYIRKREEEFGRTGLTADEIVLEIDKTLKTCLATIKNLSTDTLNKDFPIEVFGHPMSTIFFLNHLCAHLNYHLGQINYHRRLLDL